MIAKRTATLSAKGILPSDAPSGKTQPSHDARTSAPLTEEEKRARLEAMRADAEEHDNMVQQRLSAAEQKAAREAARDQSELDRRARQNARSVAPAPQFLSAPTAMTLEERLRAAHARRGGIDD